MENQQFNKLSKYVDESIGLYFTDLVSLKSTKSNHLTIDEIKSIETNTRELELLCNDADPWISTLKDFFTTRYSRKHELLENISYNEYF